MFLLVCFLSSLACNFILLILLFVVYFTIDVIFVSLQLEVYYILLFVGSQNSWILIVSTDWEIVIYNLDVSTAGEMVI